MRLFLTLKRLRGGEVLFDCGVLRKPLPPEAHGS